jgi:hypothetical protein
VVQAPAAIERNAIAIAVSCPAPTFCMASVGNGPGRQVAQYNGTSWIRPSLVDRTTGEPSSVSCPAAGICMAVDDTGNAVRYTAGRWHGPSAVVQIGQSQLESVSCTSATFCVAVDADGRAFQYDGAR